MLFGVGCGDDFEDEIYFKRGRVVRPRFLDIYFTVLIFNNSVLSDFIIYILSGLISRV